MKLFKMFKNGKNLIEKRERHITYESQESFSGGFAVSSATPSGLRMTPENALRICTVQACIRVISNAYSTLPINVYENLPSGGRRVAENLPLHWLLKYQPNDDQDAVQFKEQLVLGLLLYGNAYAQITRDSNGNITELYALDSRVTHKQKTAEGKKFYTTIRDDKALILPKSDVMHITSLGGRSPIDLARETLGEMFEMQTRNASFWANGANVSGLLKFAGKVTKPMLDNLRRSWESTYTGANNAGKTLILEQGMDFQPISVSQQQAQFIESMKLDGNQICGIFSVPPHKVGFLDDATYSNIEEQNISFVTDCLYPLIVRTEMAMMASLLSESEVKKYKFEFNLDAQLRGRALERAQKLQIERQNGVLSIDEWRQLENRNPLPDGLGNIYQVPMNMDTLGDDIEPDPNNPKNPPSIFGMQGVNPSEPTDNTAPEAKTIFLPIVKRNVEQVMRKETKMKKEKINTPEYREYLFDTFNPIFESMCACIGIQNDSDVVKKFANDWIYNAEQKIENRQDFETNNIFSFLEKIKDERQG